MTAALMACKQPVPINPADFAGCYYHQRLPHVRITATSFEVPKLGYVDKDVTFERIKSRNLIWLSSPYGIKDEFDSTGFANLGSYTKAEGLNYELTASGLYMVGFPSGRLVFFGKGKC